MCAEARVARHPLAGLILACQLLSPAAHAFDEDRAWAALARPATPAATREAPVLRLEWEQRLRTADRLGPVPLRSDDAALLEAVRTARWSEALALLKSGRAHANARDDLGAQALVPAARAGQDALVRELLRQGADTTRTDASGYTALGAAAFSGRRSTVRLLLREGVDPAQWGATGQTALHLAAIAGQTEVLEEFRRAGVDVELLNRQRESALDVAGAAGQQRAMAWLIEAGADLAGAGRR